MKTLDYACYSENHPNVDIVNLDTGENITLVIECSAKDGWLVRYVEDENGMLSVCDGNPLCYLCDREVSDIMYPHNKGDHARAERIEGNFRIIDLS